MKKKLAKILSLSVGLVVFPFGFVYVAQKILELIVDLGEGIEDLLNDLIRYYLKIEEK